MDVPKISVLIPLYNRKHYIEQCINSVLNQTFQDWELIVRDNDSIDGSAEFVEERYAEQIASGKIKLYRNEKNLGEFPNVNRLILDASGKYFMILHSDDLYLPQTLQNMYDAAEHFHADVVHGARFLDSPQDGTLKQGSPLSLRTADANPVNEVKVMPGDRLSRFVEWATDGTFIDSQYNIYNREFIRRKSLFFNQTGTLHLFLLRWLLNAKIFVKTPLIPYVRRNAPDSYSNDINKFSIEKFIAEKISLARNLKDILPELQWFDDNKEIQRFILLKFLVRSHQIQISGRGIYKNGISPELSDRVANTFKKFFGDSSPYPEMLFNLIFMIPTNQNFERIILNDSLRRILNPPPTVIIRDDLILKAA